MLRRTDDTVFLYARSGRIVTQHWMDLAVAGMELRPGTVLDGEAVIWRDGRLDFAAAQSRAASSVTRARALAARYPASYARWCEASRISPRPIFASVRPLVNRVGRLGSEERALPVLVRKSLCPGTCWG
ncbi:hypothetical protein ACFRCI_47670 [Streptomyces sp. NPDC056638]|uniref:hypothetical protein n=1 Tax=Streptomyces sp. NPDC056638 TaxID=3345887 RepID=UPI00367429FA